ncbi:hypothetical protein IWX75_003166 [Arthrobacter sp. CAN_A6]
MTKTPDTSHASLPDSNAAGWVEHSSIAPSSAPNQAKSSWS